jgi:hypothetical protein
MIPRSDVDSDNNVDKSNIYVYTVIIISNFHIGSHFNMTHQYVVITGASKGIGRATALLLDKQGFHVFAGVRSAADGEDLQKEASPK